MKNIRKQLRKGLGRPVENVIYGLTNYLQIKRVYTVGKQKRVHWHSTLTTKKSESFQDRKDSEKNFDYRFWNGYKRIKLYV